MLLAIDIGNTTIGLALMHQGKVDKEVKIDSTDNPVLLKSSLIKALNEISAMKFVKVVCICSVFPKCTVLVYKFINKILNIDSKVVGKNICVPIKNRYKNPKQVGQDRLVVAYAALKLYGKPIIVVDLGTAITFDVVSSKGEYLGGVIVPGLRLSAESLFLKTALLPEINLKAPKSPIGRTTEESILSGLFYGYGAMCKGLIDQLHHDTKGKPKAVLTGGHTDLMKRFVSPKIRIIDPFLVYKGMYFLINP